MPSLRLSILFIFLLCLHYSNAQVITHEDSLTAGLLSSEKATVISGYGEGKFSFDTRYATAKANLTRAVLFVGHKFSNNVNFFSELEVEDGKVDGDGGEIAFEQAFLKFNLSKDVYITTGLFVPRIGITNENHLPNTFNSNDRTYVETYIIPSTWRELGIGLYGNVKKIAGLNYSLALVNGLSSANFEYGTGIREGRFEGRNATASNIAATASLLYYKGAFRVQASSYVGGSAGLSKREADSLQLSYGAFGTPIMVNEVDLQFKKSGFAFKSLASVVNISNAEQINLAYANNTASMLYGYYAEIAYNLMQAFKRPTRALTIFARYENLDMNYKIPSNGITNDLLKQQFIVVGINYSPIRGAIVKLDYVYKKTGTPNAALVVNPFPQAQTFYNTNGYINLGFGYSF